MTTVKKMVVAIAIAILLLTPDAMDRGTKKDIVDATVENGSFKF